MAVCPMFATISSETGKFVIGCLICGITCKCQPSIEYYCMIFHFKIGGAVTITPIDTSIKCQPSIECKCMIFHFKTGGEVTNTPIDTGPPIIFCIFVYNSLKIPIFRKTYKYLNNSSKKTSNEIG